jgi:antitoxin component of MazEF toxin-antitoxin module
MSGSLQFDLKTLKFYMMAFIEMPEEYLNKKVYVTNEVWGQSIYLSIEKPKLGTTGIAKITTRGENSYSVEIPALNVSLSGIRSGQMLNVYLTNDGSIVFNPRSENGRMLEAYKHRTGKSEYSLKKYQKEDRIE